MGKSLGSVVLQERLHEHANGAKDADKHKDPEEKAVDDHGNILPVLTDLWVAGEVRHNVNMQRSVQLQRGEVRKRSLATLTPTELKTAKANDYLQYNNNSIQNRKMLFIN